MKKVRTREERRQFVRNVVRAALCVLLWAVVIVLTADAVAQDKPITAADYLEEIGASNEQRMYVLELYKEWENND